MMNGESITPRSHYRDSQQTVLCSSLHFSISIRNSDRVQHTELTRTDALKYGRRILVFSLGTSGL